MRFILLILLSISCGRSEALRIDQGRQVSQSIEHDPRVSNSIAQVFQPIVDRFEDLSKRQVTTPISFVNDLPANVLGLCRTFVRNDGKEFSEIVVSQEGFNPDSIEAEIVLFHELGHCELDRKHDTSLAKTLDGRTIPFSMMFPTIIDGEDYLTFKDHYHLELLGEGSILKRIGNHKN